MDDTKTEQLRQQVAHLQRLLASAEALADQRLESTLAMQRRLVEYRDSAVEHRERAAREAGKKWAAEARAGVAEVARDQLLTKIRTLKKAVRRYRIANLLTFADNMNKNFRSIK